MRRNTLRYCALHMLGCFNPENETAADGRRLHFDITL